MLVYCQNCLKRMEMSNRGKMHTFVPRVCSSKCFGEWTVKNGRLFTEIDSPDVALFTKPAPIKTMRSELEVRFRKWLDKSGIAFLYEPLIIKVAPRLVYVPDFFLMQGMFIEVKGRWGVNDTRKVELLAKKFPKQPVAVVDEEFVSMLEKTSRSARSAKTNFRLGLSTGLL